MTPFAMISPVILELGPLSLRWYGVLTALGALAAYLLVSRRLAGTAVKESKLGDIAIIAILSAIVGARLFYVIRFWNTDFAHRPLSAALKVWEGGLVFQGGFIVAALALIAYALWQHIPVGQLGDLLAPAIPLGHAIGRIGCLINGCCFGFLPYDGPCAVHYPFTPFGVFPAQAVEAAGNLLLCLLLLLAERRHLATGRRFLLYLIGYTILRCAVEPLRGDYPADQVWAGMTPGQYHALWQLPLIVAIFAAITLISRKRQRHHQQDSHVGRANSR